MNFKVGDRVRLVSEDRHYHQDKVGKIFTVTFITPDCKVLSLGEFGVFVSQVIRVVKCWL